MKDLKNIIANRNLANIHIGLSFLTGILLGCSFPPFQTGVIATVALVPLFFILSNEYETKKLFLYSYLSFFVFNLITLYWVGAFHIGKYPYLMVTGTLLLFVNSFILCIPNLIWSMLRRKLGLRPAMILMPFLWVSIEYLHSLHEAAFPWLVLGNSQTYDIAIIQITSIVGVFGLSFWIVLINVLVFFLISECMAGQSRQSRLNIAGAFLIISSLSILPKWYGNSVIHERNNKNQSGAKVAIIQPNIDSYIKWSGNIDRQLAVLRPLTQKVKETNADLVVWPETAVPLFLLLPDQESVLTIIKKEVDSLNIPLLTGYLDWHYYDDAEVAPKNSKTAVNGKHFDIYNASLLLTPQKNELQIYKKNLLVPFAERVPYAEELSFLDLDVIRWNFGAWGYKNGETQTVFTLIKKNGETVKFSNLICYESLFPYFVSKFVRRGAQFLVITTNDNYWGLTSGVFQHSQIDILRAVESRRWIVRCDNGGISGFIDPYGRIHEPTKFNTVETELFDVELRDDFTFYTLHGDWLPQICLFICLAMALIGWLPVWEYLGAKRKGYHVN